MLNDLPKLQDKHSNANMKDVPVMHYHFDWKVNWETKSLDGTVEIQAKKMNPTTSLMTLDTTHLEIQLVYQYVNGKLEACSFSMHASTLSNVLRIELNESSQENIVLLIRFHTTKDSTAIQWLPKEQTADKEYPYLFTQCQAIHARSLFPCQDCPSIKATYSARVTSSAWSQCLMSAVECEAKDVEEKAKIPLELVRTLIHPDPERQDDVVDELKTFYWKQDIPIPSYLVAMVVGHLKSEEIGPRSRVWSEPSMVKDVAFEFSQTEQFIQYAEDIMKQEYVWGRYDLVCLPPSFPYGGMENPCLTFVTPTLLAGDRSLADVVAHEIAHSWTGNLITNQTWEHFWLNEGWTVWLQRKIMARIHSNLYFDFDAAIGWKDLVDSVKLFGCEHKFTCMVPNLDEVDPDDSFSAVPYEKGFNFLYYLSTLVGEEAFEAFAQAYVQRFKFTTLTSTDFKDFFLEYFGQRDERSLQKTLDEIDWETWFHRPGMPPITPHFDTSISQASHALAQKWLHESGKGCFADDMKGWTSSQIVAMLEKILVELEKDSSSSSTTSTTSTSVKINVDQLLHMDRLYSFSLTKNAEVRFRWQTLCLKSHASFIFPQVETFLKEQGRMKFVRPLYRNLYHSTGGGKEWAVKIFKEWKDNYHPIAQKMIGKDLGIEA